MVESPVCDDALFARCAVFDQWGIDAGTNNAGPNNAGQVRRILLKPVSNAPLIDGKLNSGLKRGGQVRGLQNEEAWGGHTCHNERA
jgi:hypothetical protein